MTSAKIGHMREVYDRLSVEFITRNERLTDIAPIQDIHATLMQIQASIEFGNQQGYHNSDNGSMNRHYRNQGAYVE